MSKVQYANYTDSPLKALRLILNHLPDTQICISIIDYIKQSFLNHLPEIDEYVYRSIYIDFIDDEFPNISLLWNYQSMFINDTTSTGYCWE